MRNAVLSKLNSTSGVNNGNPRHLYFLCQTNRKQIEVKDPADINVNITRNRKHGAVANACKMSPESTRPKKILKSKT